MIERYLTSAYLDGGRGPDAFDCWGLVRHARHHMLGKPLMPEYGLVPADDKAGLTEAVAVESSAFTTCKPIPGAIATAWERRLCTHVGLVLSVDGRPMVLETNAGSGPRLTPVRAFERRFSRVIYWND